MRQVEIISEKKVTQVVLDENINIFIVFVDFFSLRTKMIIVSSENLNYLIWY